MKKKQQNKLRQINFSSKSITSIKLRIFFLTKTNCSLVFTFRDKLTAEIDTHTDVNLVFFVGDRGRGNFYRLSFFRSRHFSEWKNIVQSLELGACIDTMSNANPTLTFTEFFDIDMSCYLQKTNVNF